MEINNLPFLSSSNVSETTIVDEIFNANSMITNENDLPSHDGAGMVDA